MHVNQQVAEDALDLLAGARRSGIPFVSTIHVAKSAAALGARYGRLRDIVAAECDCAGRGIHIVVADQCQTGPAGLAPAWQRRRHRPGMEWCRRADAAATCRMHGFWRRQEWGTGGEVLVVGGVGRLQAQKNPEFALRVAAELKARGRPIHFVWIGDGPLKEALLRRGAEVGMSDNMTIDGWRSDAAHRVAGLDLLLMPSRFEGLPLALLEAMHAGIAVMARDVDGIPEAIVDGISGILCSGASPADWCDRLEAMVPSPAERSDLEPRSKGRDRFLASRL